MTNSEYEILIETLNLKISEDREFQNWTREQILEIRTELRDLQEEQRVTQTQLADLQTYGYWIFAAIGIFIALAALFTPLYIALFQKKEAPAPAPESPRYRDLKDMIQDEIAQALKTLQAPHR